MRGGNLRWRTLRYRYGRIVGSGVEDDVEPPLRLGEASLFRGRAEIRHRVIGNSNYPSGRLGSPKDDAKAVEAKLNSLGVQVTRKTDVNRKQFLDSLRQFGQLLQQEESVIVFYYSGHGMQVNNRNYMVPIDADIQSEYDVSNYAVAVDDVLGRMPRGLKNLKIVILDACRNNPYEKRFKDSQVGLARMDSPQDTLIAFAAEPGKVVEAGSGGRLSMYSQTLVDHIDRPYPNILHMFQSVVDEVSERSAGQQNPRYENSARLALQFSFRPIAVGDDISSISVKLAPLVQQLTSELERLETRLSVDDTARLKQPLAKLEDLIQTSSREAGRTKTAGVDADMGNALASIVKALGDAINETSLQDDLNPNQVQILNGMRDKHSELADLLLTNQETARKIRETPIKSLRF